MNAHFVVLALVAAAAMPFSAATPANYTCTVDNGAMVVDHCTMQSDEYGWRVGSTATVQFIGHATKNIIAGGFKYQLWEDEVRQFVSQGNEAYFTCNNKGCDRSEPIGLHLMNPGSVPTQFSAKFEFTIPKPQKSGHFHIVFWGQDQDHYPYDLNGMSEFSVSCTKDSDCPAGSYCMNYAGKTPPYSCH